MPKDARLTIRITDELDTWLGAEAAKRGLDKAAFARMALFERMNGPAIPVIVAPSQPVARDVLAVATTTHLAEASASTEPAEPVDVDALVARQVQEAEAAGLTAVPELDVVEANPEAGVRPLFRRPTPFTQALPAFLGGQ